MFIFSYDATTFTREVKDNATKLKRKNKTQRQVRWYSYCKWAYAIKSKDVGPSNATYSFPPSVLNFIREATPGDIKGELRDDAYVVTLEEFCVANVIIIM